MANVSKIVVVATMGLLVASCGKPDEAKTGDLILECMWGVGGGDLSPIVFKINSKKNWFLVWDDTKNDWDGYPSSREKYDVSVSDEVIRVASHAVAPEINRELFLRWDFDRVTGAMTVSDGQKVDREIRYVVDGAGTCNRLEEYPPKRAKADGPKAF